MMNFIDPQQVSVELDDDGDGPPEVAIIEAYPAGSNVENVAQIYRRLLGDGAEVNVTDEDGRTVVRASTATMPREAALRLAGATAVNLIQRAGGIDELAAALAAANVDDDGRGFQ